MPVDPAELRIVHYPDPVLRRKASPVAEITAEVRAVAARMGELMREAGGVGLAAPQVGLNWRLFVTAPDRDHRDGEARAYINPVLHASGPADEDEEGCLSLPDIHVDVLRPSSVTMTATTLDGRQITVTETGFMARVWQHENDHLNGTLIIDRMTPMQRLATRRMLKDLELAAKIAT